MKTKENGITLIALVITIIILIILAGVSINLILGENGIVTKAKAAKIRTEFSSIEEEVKTYILAKEIDSVNNVKEKYPLTIDKNGNYKTIKNTLTQDQIDSFDEDLKVKLYQLEKQVSNNSDFTINDTTYEIFYRLDENKIQSAKKYKDKLYFFITNNEYKLIYTDGLEISGEKAYSVLPLETKVKSDYFTAGNNTFKLSKGTLRAIGQKNTFSGFTNNDLIQYTNWQELDIAGLSSNQIIQPIKEELFCNGTAFLIDNNNVLWAWGDNSNNKLGLGNSYTQLKPIKIFENAKHVWSGEMNTYVVDQDGILWGAGQNTSGALGQGNTNVYLNFVKISGINGNDIIKILPSLNFESNNAIIYTTEKKIYGLGWIGFDIINLSCTKVTDLSANTLYNNVDDVAFHGQSMYILKDSILYGIGRTQDSSLAVTGHGNSTPTIKYTSPKQLATNVDRMSMYCYLTNEGNLYYVCDGQGECKFRQVYNSDDTIFQNLNVEIEFVGRGTSPQIYINGKAYVFSYNSNKNRVYLTQYTSYSNLIPSKVISTSAVKLQTGKYIVANSIITNGENLKQLEFKEVTNKNIISAQASTNYSNIIDKDYKLYKGTGNGYVLDKIENVKKVLSSDSGVVLLTRDGKIYRKGSGNYGGTGSIVNLSDYAALIDKNGKKFSNVKDIALSIRYQYSTFVTEENELYYIGHKYYASLPNKETNGTFSINGQPLYPVKVESTMLSKILPKYSSMSINNSKVGGKSLGATYILTTEGELYTFDNLSGELSGLGRNTTDFEKLNLPDKVKQVKSQDGYTMALLENGKIYAWGYNTYGQFGTGEENIGKVYATPIKLVIERKVTNFALGEGFAIFELFDGTIVGAGKNEYGQLGTGDSISTSTFVRCKNLEN